MTRSQPELMLSLVPSEITAQVGVVITQWAWTEVLTDQLLWCLLGLTSKMGRAVATQDRICILLAREQLDRHEASHRPTSQNGASGTKQLMGRYRISRCAKSNHLIR